MTKQELQDKIHEAGFEPPYYEAEGAIHGEFLFHGKYVNEELAKARDSGLFTPHYPCEWLWEKLPKRITVASLDYEAYKALDVDHGLTYLIPGGYGSHWTWDSIPQFNVTKKNDLHQALLELFVWCIENNHIKL